jgi:diguanylate cyclase (GGDEF)-like protein
MTRWVLERRQILTRQAVDENYELRGLLEEEPGMPDAMAPLTVGGELLGVLVAHGTARDGRNSVRMLYTLANIYALGIKNAQLFRRVEELARRDGLTGLLNHATFQHEFGTLCESAAAQGSKLTLLMGDIDHFKRFNDTHGHQAGDHVLREVSRVWRAVLPDHAVTGRYGGEEFVAALPGESLERARELAELLRSTLQALDVDFEGRTLHVTSSFGVAEFGSPAASAEELVKQADAGLYEAKRGGRNRVVAGNVVAGGGFAGVAG